MVTELASRSSGEPHLGSHQLVIGIPTVGLDHRDRRQVARWRSACVGEVASTLGRLDLSADSTHLPLEVDLVTDLHEECEHRTIPSVRSPPVEVMLLIQ